jgi:hypothetical protein
VPSRKARTPTPKQYASLRVLASGGAGLSWTKRDTESLLGHGWVAATWDAPYYQRVRITPMGLRALADAVELHGLPDLGPKPTYRRRVCADCGSARWHIEQVTAEEALRP